MNRILIEVHEGQVVRNLLENNLLDFLIDQGQEVCIISPGARVRIFSERYNHPNVRFLDKNLIDAPLLSRAEKLEFAMGRWLSRNGNARLRRMMWQLWGAPMSTRRGDIERAILKEEQPDVVVSTHVSQLYGRKLVVQARQRGIPTVGNLNSWDNVWKGLKVRPKTVTCWSSNDRDQLIRLAGYKPEDIKIIGAPAFDAYFAPDAQWSRNDFCSRLGLKSDSPILLFATLGQFRQQIDETNPFEYLLKAIDTEKIHGKPQIILRLHPWSRETYFLPYSSRSDVTVSRYENYVPGLTWTPTRDEAIMAGNILRHADVVVTPGSTMAIEAAIFDTPTIVPVFNEYMPEVFKAYFQSTWLDKHFANLFHSEWIPVANSGQEMVDGVNAGLADRNWYRSGRAKIREEILGPLDGKATQRFAEVILNSVQKTKNDG